VNTLELCRVLLAGSVPAAEVPELSDEEIHADVRRRLAEAGCELSYAPGSDRWVATLAGPMPRLEEHAPVVDLGPAELTTLAACWLHLRFLPTEKARQGGTADGGDTPWLDPDDLGTMLGGRLGGDDLPSTLERLCQAGYLTLHEGQLFAGPLLETFDDEAASDQARELLARNQRLTHLRGRAAEIRAETTGPERPAAPNPEWSDEPSGKGAGSWGAVGGASSPHMER
jgi:hypothetical protein